MDPVWLILLSPLAGAVVLLLAGRRMGRTAGLVGSAAVLVAFAAALVSFAALLGRGHGARAHVLHAYDWAVIGQLDVGVTIRFDELSALMCVMVTGVAFLIHVYSTSYMHGDPRFSRFFAYLNLFVFSMLVLVLADNLLLLFAGWEGVGLCSYLLIGFWHERPRAASAAKKAFLVTRIGDTGLLIGIFLLFTAVGTLDISGVLRAATTGNIAVGTATAAGLLLFAGAVGKSAQLPLYVWLPDAMEGPSPVSALIHAATMVTAGVYLVVRLNPLYELSHTAGGVVAVVGVSTAIFAAVLAMAEDDIKRVLAYSTVSQLGFMFLAAGVGAYGAAMFHLITHAFFKALLFLAAGSVMHGLAEETSLDRMGGLRKAMPATFAVTFVGWGAITGVLPFAGFFSKDAIVAAVWHEHRTVLFAAAVVAAALTAFYMSRLLFLAFFGSPRWSEGTHPHESGPTMVLPMVGLAVMAAIGGILNLPGPFPRPFWLDQFLAPVVGKSEHGEGFGVPLLLWTVTAVAILGAWWVYAADPSRRETVRGRLGPVNTIVRNKFYVDEIYASFIVAPLRLLATFAAYVVDRRVIDGAVNGIGSVVTGAAGSWRRVQSGLVRNYAVGVAAGAAALVAWLALRGMP
ncbi:MAG TPA: NADH-quinone oxidoreductase subunit L [Actinomycetota bacterium]|nr:NADH-quinone oxidoreductase subunit L [Actinomycetota bacterium]